jgi:hypothetical protein
MGGKGWILSHCLLLFIYLFFQTHPIKLES